MLIISSLMVGSAIYGNIEKIKVTRYNYAQTKLSSRFHASAHVHQVTNLPILDINMRYIFEGHVCIAFLFIVIWERIEKCKKGKIVFPVGKECLSKNVQLHIFVSMIN